MAEIHRIPGYELTKKIGRGSFSTVYKAMRHKDKAVVAIKAINREKVKKKNNAMAVKEIQLMKNLVHVNIIQICDFGYDAVNIYIVMELCTEGDLAKLIQQKCKLSEQFLLFLMQQLAAALKFLKDKDICHMDLKPANILLTKTPNLTLKVADFGLSHIITDDNMECYRFAGSYQYMAPEKILNQRYDSKIDLWAVGVIMYECLVGRPFFQNTSVTTITETMLLRKPVSIPPCVSISEPCDDMLTRLIQYNPNDRISFEDFFNHDFLKLNYLPTPENYQLVSDYITEAKALEVQGKCTQAIVLCKKAIAYLDGFSYTETNPEKRQSVLTKKKEYDLYLRNLYLLAEGQSGANAKLTMTINEGQYQQLLQLCASTPEIHGAVQLGHLGEMYAIEDKRVIALDYLTAALDVLLPLMHNEPPGDRKNMLLTKIKVWIHIAEVLKASLNL